VTGLTTGTTLALTDGSSTVTLSSAGPFAFSDGFVAGQAYQVSVATQPQGQVCQVSANASGTIDAAGDSIGNIAVQCAAPGTLNGMVQGLPANGSLTLSDGSTSLQLQNNGSFGFSDTQAAGAAYQVSVTAPPAGQSCTVTSGQGTLDAADDAVFGVQVSCYSQGTLNGTVSGLATGQSVTLSDGLSSLTLSANGSFAFADVLAANASYTVSVGTQPTGQTCTVSNGAGSIDGNDDAVSGIAVSCQ